MLPIYPARQLKSWDQFTISRKNMVSIDLMETAANKFVNWFIKDNGPNNPILIICGNGNNGGDGLAIARLLSRKSYEIKVVLLKTSDENSPNYEINLNRLESYNISILESKLEVCQFLKQAPNTLVIDAILGYGINREVKDDLLDWIHFVNQCGLVVFSIDIPSGMFVEMMTHSECIHANFTFSFQIPKLCHLIPETGKYCGTLIVENIDLDSSFLLENPTDLNFLELNDIKLLYRPRNAFDWKNKYGHLLIVGGNSGMAGAIILSALASLRSGCGLCTIHSIECNREIIQISLPEAIFLRDEKIDHSKYSALVIGPGMGMEPERKQVLKELLFAFKKPLVLDADALNIIAIEKWQSMLRENCILTPHVGEFDRLFGFHSNGFDRLKKAIEICSELSIHIILKGKYSAIICPDKKVFFNSTGNPGLAKGGSGDVLSGILGSFLAQSYSILDASKLAVYIHGLSADIANEQIAQESIISTDVIQNISNSFIRLNA